jgi:hypothetical protein
MAASPGNMTLLPALGAAEALVPPVMNIVLIAARTASINTTAPGKKTLCRGFVASIIIACDIVYSPLKWTS